MKKFKFALGIIMLGFLTSCGGGNSNSVTLQVESELGELGNYITITDSEVTVQLVDDKKDGKDVKSIVSSLAINVTKSVASDYSFSFNVEVLDANHVKIADLPSYYLDYKSDSDNGDYDYYLTAGNVRAQMKESEDAEKWNEEAQQMWDKIRKEGKFILIKPNFDSAKYAPYNSESNSNISESDDNGEDIVIIEEEAEAEPTTASSASSSDEDFDEFLSAYESYIDKYIAMLKKAKDGDYTAMAEAATLMKDAQAYAEKLQKISGNLTPAQLAKFQKLQQKLIKAAQ